MKHNVIPALQFLLTPIENVTLLPGNPHEGDVEAMRASMREIGQHRPVVARRTGEDTGVASAGNTMVKAAELEGWTHLAVAFVDENESEAKIRALIDNQVAKLGKDDPDKLALMIPEVIDFNPELFAIVGWDDFEIASIETSVTYEQPTGYTPPRFVDDPEPREEPRREPKTPDTQGRTAEDLIKTGAGDTDDKRQAVIQYTLVFSSSEQQRRWHEFVKWLRNDPGVDGETTTDRLMDFVEQHAEF